MVEFLQFKVGSRTKGNMSGNIKKKIKSNQKHWAPQKHERREWTLSMQQLHDLQWYKDCTSLTSTCKVALWLTGLWDQLSDRIFSRPSFSKRCWKKKKNQIKQTGFQLFWFDQTLNDSSHIRPHISDANWIPLVLNLKQISGNVLKQTFYYGWSLCSTSLWLSGWTWTIKETWN